MVSGIKNGAETVMRNAINSTLSTVQTQAVARIGNELNLTAARIKQDFWIDRASLAKQGGGVYAKGAPIGLVSYGAKQTGSLRTHNTGDMQVKIKRAGGWKTLKHAFFAITKGGILNVYWREYAGTRSAWNPIKAYNRMPSQFRFPLVRLTGPRIEDIYGADRVFDPVTLQAQTIFASRVEDEMNDLLRRYP